jgi:hypothetical protein
LLQKDNWQSFNYYKLLDGFLLIFSFVRAFFTRLPFGI